MVKEICIEGKPVFLVESHNHIVLGWLKIRTKMPEIPYLITFDHHTDTKEAFRGESFSRTVANYFEEALIVQKNLTEFFLSEDNCIEKMVCLLKNDEHIDAAIKKGIISHAFSINHMDSSGTLSIEENEYNNKISEDLELYLFGGLPEPQKPYNYLVTSNNIFHIPHQSNVNNNIISDMNYYAIDDCLLNIQIQNMMQMSETSGLGKLNDHPFILDIDLDYFHTTKSIQPQNKSVFYDLIRKSSAITVAKESGCVIENRIDNKITSEFLLQILLNHIKEALK